MKTEKKPRRGVTSLLARTRALAKTHNLKAKALATGTGVSVPVAQRIINNELNNVAIKTETRLRDWLKAIEGKPAPVPVIKPVIKPTPPKHGKDFQVVIDNLEREVATKDYTVRQFRILCAKQERKINKLKRQRNKLIKLL